jgi:thiamine-phosphate diphosphorylase
MVLIPKIYIITNSEISVEKQLQFFKKLKDLKNQDVIIQIRMPHLEESELYYFIENTKKTLPKNIKILINNRIDLMEKFDLNGVHFKDKDINIDLKIYKDEGKIFAKSTHSISSIENAIDNNIDFVTYGPIFYTKSKEIYGDPIGFEALINKNLKIPIFALGGIDSNTINYLPSNLFYGVGAIKLFSNNNIIKNIIKIRRKIEGINKELNVK